jgi:hypothetical protein
MNFDDFEWPKTIEEQKKDYTISYSGPTNLGIKSTLRNWEYTVLPDGVLVRNYAISYVFK